MANPMILSNWVSANDLSAVQQRNCLYTGLRSAFVGKNEGENAF